MELIKEHLSKYDFDIRKTGDARFMDQKVTPDVLCIIADCVMQFIKDDLNKEFTTKDIWDSPYANDNIKDIFNKPDVLSEKARSEYDKFFAQPLKTLAYSQILKCTKKGNKNIFVVANTELLSYISIKERNAIEFLVLYLEKVLKDSGVWYLFENFFVGQDKESFYLLKDGFKKFIYEHTNIRESNKYEPGRIFTKIINPLSYTKKLLGTRGGFLSSDTIDHDELMYNRKNWRDVVKQKDETRQEYEHRAKNEVERTKSAFIRFTVDKAKRLIRERHNYLSEVKDEFGNGRATQVHHIFPKTDCPQIESYLENLILLTPSQHAAKAHPDNNTRRVDKNYQLLCLLSKSASVQESVNSKDGFYSKEDYVYVLNEGLHSPGTFSIIKSFEEIEKQLVYEYHRT